MEELNNNTENIVVNPENTEMFPDENSVETARKLGRVGWKARFINWNEEQYQDASRKIEEFEVAKAAEKRVDPYQRRTMRNIKKRRANYVIGGQSFNNDSNIKTRRI